MDGPFTARIQRGTTGSLSVELRSLFVRVRRGRDEGRRAGFALSLVRIGSADDNDLVLSDPSVSRYHAELRVEPDGVVLRDLGSTNGSFVAGVQVTEARVPPGTPIVLGEEELSLETRDDSRAGFVGQEESLGELVGASPAMRELYGMIRAVAPTHATVLLLGESGTGKELAARALHEASRRSGPLVPFDAASTDPEQMRSELLGHVKGAFTGAAQDREGAFRRAHRGTLFLDEIGELPLDLQARLLRVLETREVTPLGSDRSEKVDVRVVAATHQDLASRARLGTFRLDLYHRLAVVPIRVPALRERIADLRMLVPRILERLGTSCAFRPDAWKVLEAHSWPGNVRELRNLLERFGATHAGREVGGDEVRRAIDLHAGLAAPLAPLPGPVPAGLPGQAPAGNAASMADIERQTILDALAKHDGNKAATARALGISLSTLQRRLKDYQPGS